MKLMKTSILVATIAIGSWMSFESNAAQNCPTCGGYWYKAYTELNNGGMVTVQYADRGPYASAQECQDAVSLDQGNNDSWLPYFGSPVCAFRFDSDLDAYKEILDFWNNTAPPTHSGAGVMDNEELIRETTTLRQSYDIKSYEHALELMITDPELDITDPEM